MKSAAKPPVPPRIRAGSLRSGHGGSAHLRLHGSRLSDLSLDSRDFDTASATRIKVHRPDFSRLTGPVHIGIEGANIRLSNRRSGPAITGVTGATSCSPLLNSPR
jgi:hypothetical protein